MKKQTEIIAGILILIVGFFIGIISAIIVVESNIPSSASNDGWLGFLGGLFGSFISGAITFFVLYINRNDADKAAKDNKEQTRLLQLESNHQFYESMKQQSAILKYQTNMKISDDVMALIAELIKIAEDYYVYVADNTLGHFIEQLNRSLEICVLLEMKLYGIDDSDDLVKSAKIYQQIFCQRRPPCKAQKEKLEEIRKHSDGLRHKAEEFCYGIKDIDGIY